MRCHHIWALLCPLNSKSDVDDPRDDLTASPCNSLLRRILQVSMNVVMMTKLTQFILASQTRGTILGLERELCFFIDTYLVRRVSLASRHFCSTFHRSELPDNSESVLKQ